MPIALVTDSTASLPPQVAAQHGVHVVPLQVVIGSAAHDEGEPETTPELVAEALRAWKPVSTSRPTPELIRETFQRLVDDGATEIVAVHISAQMSGTYESALLAAKEIEVPVYVVDSAQVGLGTGFAVLAAAEVLETGGGGLEAADAARRRAHATTSLFYVDTLEYLRRGGRIGGAAALLGSALAVKPILRINEGRVGPFERVRTTGKALARLEELAIDAAGKTQVDVAVAHLASEERASKLSGALGERLGAQLQGRPVRTGQIGAVLGAHVGPGMVAVIVAPRLRA